MHKLHRLLALEQSRYAYTVQEYAETRLFSG